MLAIPLHNKRAAVWYLSIVPMTALARKVGITVRSCLPKNTCSISTTRVFLDLVGITRPPVNVQCAKRNTSTTTLEHWTDISIKELRAMLTAHNIQLFDVREPYELMETGKIACATNIPLRKVPEAFTMDPEEFEEEYNVKKPEKNDANIVFHCLAGIRSRAAMDAVHQIGYTKARHYPGGYMEWTSQVDNSEKSNG